MNRFHEHNTVHYPPCTALRTSSIGPPAAHPSALIKLPSLFAPTQCPTPSPIVHHGIQRDPTLPHPGADGEVRPGHAHPSGPRSRIHHWCRFHRCRHLLDVSPSLPWASQLLDLYYRAYGVTCCQTFYYYRSNRGRADPWYYKTLVSPQVYLPLVVTHDPLGCRPSVIPFALARAPNATESSAAFSILFIKHSSSIRFTITWWKTTGTPLH